MTINNNGDNGRAIETRGKITSFTLEGCTINITGKGNNQGITIGGSQTSKAEINIKGSTISVGNAGYPIIAYNPMTLSINNSKLTGYSAIYFKGVVSSEGSHNSVVNIANCEYICPNVYDKGSNDFGAFVFEDDGITIDVVDSKINAESKGTALQSLFQLNAYAGRKSQSIKATVSGNSSVAGTLVDDGWGTSPSPLEITISGGYITADPTAYLANGKVALSSDKANYTFMVGTAPENVVVKPAAPEVEKVDTSGLTGTELDNANTLNDLAGTVKTDTTDTGLVTSTGKVAQDLTVTNTEARTALGNKASAQDTVTIVIEPKLLVKPLNYDATKKELTLDIKAVYDTIATTDPENITAANSEKIGETKELEVKDGTPVIVKFEVPESLINEISTGVYSSLTVKHVKKDGTVYYYTAAVAAENSVVYGTMKVTHGFSTFIIKSLDSRKLLVTYDYDPNTKIIYDINSVNSVTFDAAPDKAGYTFAGYEFEGVKGTYKTLTESLWNTLMNGVTTSKEVKATAKYVKVVSTGDTTNTVVPFAMLGVALLGLGVVLINKRRKNCR